MFLIFHPGRWLVAFSLLTPSSIRELKIMNFFPQFLSSSFKINPGGWYGAVPLSPTPPVAKDKVNILYHYSYIIGYFADSGLTRLDNIGPSHYFWPTHQCIFPSQNFLNHPEQMLELYFKRFWVLGPLSFRIKGIQTTSINENCSVTAGSLVDEHPLR